MSKKEKTFYILLLMVFIAIGGIILYGEDKPNIYNNANGRQN